jgi:nucleotide-binding universal stress UspA family protein
MFKNPIYLIPYDFTPLAESALRLGLDLAEANDGSVYILHVVKKNAEKIQARTKFTALFNTLSKEEQAMTNTKVIVGDLYEDIGKAGDILKAALIVMGTHGAHGMQKVFGSHAVRIINSSSTPFLITQGKKTNRQNQNTHNAVQLCKRKYSNYILCSRNRKKIQCNHTLGRIPRQRQRV